MFDVVASPSVTRIMYTSESWEGGKDSFTLVVKPHEAIELYHKLGEAFDQKGK